MPESADIEKFFAALQEQPAVAGQAAKFKKAMLRLIQIMMQTAEDLERVAEVPGLHPELSESFHLYGKAHTSFFEAMRPLLVKRPDPPIENMKNALNFIKAFSDSASKCFDAFLKNPPHSEFTTTLGAFARLAIKCQQLPKTDTNSK